MDVHSSFLALSLADIEAHVDELVAEHIDGADRSRVMSYLNQTLAKDKAKVREYRRILGRARRKLDAVHEAAPIDYVKHTSLFAVNTADRWTRMKAALLVAGSDVRGIAGLASVTENLVIDGDSIMLDGISNGLKAVGETLKCGFKLTGLVQIEGANIRIRGVHFVTPAGPGAVAGNFPDDISKGVGFTGAASNIVFEDCIFEAAGDDCVFWYGGTNLVSGDITIRNCIVKGYDSWMLADFNTGSSASGTTALGTVKIEDCLFKDCAGSIAARGLIADPIKLFKCTGCTFAHGSSLHASFWSSIECNNMRRAIVQDNIATGALTGAAGEDRGFFQCWSKSPKDWEITFQRNTLTNFVFALQVATSAGFYNADYHSDRHVIVSETGSYSTVTYGASFAYPWLTGTFAPENETRLPNKATHTFADSLTVLPA